MTSDLYIAGTGGTVIYRDNDELFCRTLNDFETPHPCRAGEISFMVDCGAEFIRVNNFCGFDLLKPDIELERNKKQALSLSLSGLDSALSEETRLMCIEAAEELAADDRVLHFLKARLLARIVPEAADITAGLRGALRSDAVRLGSLYKTMRITQADIEMVNDAWRKTALSRFDSAEEALAVENVLINAGVFAGMVEALQHETRKQLETLVVTFGIRPEVKRIHPQMVMILNDIKNVIVRTGFWVDEEREFKLVDDEIETESFDADPIEKLIQNYAQVVRKNIAGHEAKAKVDSQILKISEFIRKGDLRRAEYFLIDLVKFNLATGNRFNLGQSLCKLTKNALVSGALSFAAKLSAYSLLLKIDDRVIFTTHAEVLKAKGMLSEALEAYNLTIERFADDVIARSGRAEVLKEMGKYPEALEAYDLTIERFTDNVVARNGRAELLKEMGQYPEALDAYNLTIERFADNVVARSGRAEVLKEMGKYPEALDAYDQTIKRFADDVVARAGRAEILKEMGKYPEALDAYDLTIERFVDNVVARNGRAEVLKEMGKYPEALDAYDLTIERFADDVVARSGRAEVLKEMGKYQEALDAYDLTVERFANDVVARTGRAEVLKEMGKYPEALDAYDETIVRFAGSVVARTGRAEVLKEMGKYPEALDAYDETIVRFPNDVFACIGRAEVLKKMGQYSEALEAYDETIVRFPNDVVACNGRAEVLKKMGQYSEALEAYDETIVRFPNDVVASNGRAEVMKEMGQYHEALEAYDETIVRFPNDVVACNGRTEVLKEMGQYHEALEAYDETIVRFPNDVVACNGRAEVLKEMGKYQEALEAYDETIVRFANNRPARNGLASLLILLGRTAEVPALLNIDQCISKDDWRDYHVVAMSYLRSGNLDEAMQRLQYGFDNDPFPASKEYFASALAYAKIKKKEYADIEPIFQNLPETHNQFEAQKRHLLLAHSKAAQEKKDEAINELARVPATGNNHIVKLKEFLDERYCLSDRFCCAAADEYSRLDQVIEEEELFLVMTRKAA